MTGIFHCAAVQNFIKMPLITCPNVGSRKVFKYQMEKKHLESGKCQGLPPETLNSSKSIVKRDNGYCVCCVMLRLNIQTTSVGIKSYVEKVKSCCLRVMYATSNSNLNPNWRGTSKFIPELFLLATFAQRVSRGKTT